MRMRISCELERTIHGRSSSSTVASAATDDDGDDTIRFPPIRQLISLLLNDYGQTNSSIRQRLVYL